jgi:transposase
MKAALSAQINKSDRNDARGITQMMRAGLYSPVHVMTLAGQKRRMPPTSRQLLQAKALGASRTICVARCLSASRLAW